MGWGGFYIGDELKPVLAAYKFFVVSELASRWPPGPELFLQTLNDLNEISPGSDISTTKNLHAESTSSISRWGGDGEGSF